MKRRFCSRSRSPGAQARAVVAEHELVVVVVTDAQQEVDRRGGVGRGENVVRGGALVDAREAHLDEALGV